MNKGLLALAMGTFALGISEFLMMGILGDLAANLGVSITEAGHFISAYALGVCCGAPALLFSRKMALKKIMLILAAIITIGNLCASMAPNFWTLFAARFLSGLPHGAYFGVGAIVARKLAAPGKEVSAVSYMIAGMTVATLLGVPMGTFISNMFTWRIAFVVVGVTGALTFFAIHSWIPKLPGLPDMGFKGQFRFLKTPSAVAHLWRRAFRADRNLLLVQLYRSAAHPGCGVLDRSADMADGACWIRYVCRKSYSWEIERPLQAVVGSRMGSGFSHSGADTFLFPVSVSDCRRCADDARHRRPLRLGKSAAIVDRGLCPRRRNARRRLYPDRI